MTAGAKAYASLFPVAERQAEKTVPVFQAEIAKGSRREGGESEHVKESLAERQARAAIALIRLGHAARSGPCCGTAPTPGCEASSSTG